MIITPLPKNKLESFFNKDAKEVLSYYIFKAVLSQPELIPDQSELPIQVPKEHIEQWGVQSLGLNSIGAGSYPIDLIDNNGKFGADIKMLSWNGKGGESGETSLGQKFAGSDLDSLFVNKKYDKIIRTWEEILTNKFNTEFSKYINLKDIYYFIFIRDGKKFHVCGMEVNTKNFNNMSVAKFSNASVWVDNFIEDQYGSIKIYKAKKRMEHRLRPQKWITDKLVITFDIGEYHTKSRKIKNLSIEGRYDAYKNDMRELYKAYCGYHDKDTKSLEN